MFVIFAVTDKSKGTKGLSAFIQDRPEGESAGAGGQGL